MLDFLKSKPQKITAILGHPDSDSYCGALFDAYITGARDGGASVAALRLGDLSFDPILHEGYNQIQTLEPDLVEAQRLIRWAEHIVIVYPTWWSLPPALLKGFIDRAWLPGFAYRFKANGLLRDKLLSGRSAHLIVTLDAPAIYYRLRYGAPGHRAMRDATLGFAGISPVKITEIDLVRFSDEETRNSWLNDVRRLGERRS